MVYVFISFIAACALFAHMPEELGKIILASVWGLMALAAIVATVRSVFLLLA